MLNSLKRFFSKRLLRVRACSVDDFTQAAIEVGIVCLSAFLPIWLGTIVFSLTTIPGSARKFTAAFMTSGEALLIACGIIGPLIYVITKRYGRLEDPLTLRFPYSPAFSLIITLIWLVAGVVFVFNKLSDFGYLAPTILDKPTVWQLSLWTVVGSVAVLYLATAFRNSMDRKDAAGMMHDDQERFVEEFTNG